MRLAMRNGRMKTDQRCARQSAALAVSEILYSAVDVIDFFYLCDACVTGPLVGEESLILLRRDAGFGNVTSFRLASPTRHAGMPSAPMSGIAYEIKRCLLMTNRQDLPGFGAKSVKSYSPPNNMHTHYLMRPAGYALFILSAIRAELMRARGGNCSARIRLVVQRSIKQWPSVHF